MPPWAILYKVEQSLKCSIILSRKGQRRQAHKPHPRHGSLSTSSRAWPGVKAFCDRYSRTGRRGPRRAIHLHHRTHARTPPHPGCTQASRGAQLQALRHTHNHCFLQKETLLRVCHPSNPTVMWSAASLAFWLSGLPCKLGPAP